MLDLIDRLEINSVYGVNNSNTWVFQPLKSKITEQWAKFKSGGWTQCLCWELALGAQWPPIFRRDWALQGWAYIHFSEHRYLVVSLDLQTDLTHSEKSDKDPEGTHSGVVKGQRFGFDFYDLLVPLEIWLPLSQPHFHTGNTKALTMLILWDRKFNETTSGNCLAQRPAQI